MDPEGCTWSLPGSAGWTIPGFSQSTGNDTKPCWFFPDIPIPTESRLLKLFPARLCPIRVLRSPLPSVCCHSRLFMLPRDSDGIKSFQDTRTAFLPFLLHPGAGGIPRKSSWMRSSGAGRGQRPKMDPHSSIPSSSQHFQDPTRSRGRKTRSAGSSLGSRSSLFPAWQSQERISQEKSSSFPGIIPQNPPFPKETIPGPSSKGF